VGNTRRHARIDVQALRFNRLTARFTDAVVPCIKGAKNAVNVIKQLFALL
jgi:hypothetical protein